MARAGAPEGGSAGGWELVFHKGQSQVAKPQAAAICAGALQLCPLEPSPVSSAPSLVCSCCYALIGCSMVLPLQSSQE